MSSQLDNLYRVQKQDAPKAGAVLADAFRDDPIWKLFFKAGTGFDQRGIMFESPIRFGLTYGEVYAPSDQLEGIAVWLPGEQADMTVWRLLRSGALIAGLKAMRVCTKLTRKQGRIFRPLMADRKANMEGRSYLYLMIIGVASEFQGQGYGGRLLGALIEESERAGLPIYVETESEANVRLYEKLGFKVLNRITLPVIELPMWEMVREPGT